MNMNPDYVRTTRRIEDLVSVIGLIRTIQPHLIVFSLLAVVFWKFYGMPGIFATIPPFGFALSMIMLGHYGRKLNATMEDLLEIESDT